MTATLAGHRATHARAYLPAWGVWWAEVSVDGDHALAGRVELRIADLTLAGTVVSGGPSKGRSHYRIAGGSAGWATSAPARSYANDAGVKLTTIIADAAAAAGEELDLATVPSTRVGPSYVRPAGPVARVLEQHAPSGWYVDEAGRTRLGRRAAAPLVVEAVRGPLDAARRTVTLAAKLVATILPGVVVDGLEAVDVQHDVGPDTGLRSTIWGDAPKNPLRDIVRQLLPDYAFRGGPYEYRVVTREGERVNLQPVRSSVGMPDLRRVTVRPGVPGVRADVALGARVLVGFVDNDPARPFVAAFEDADGDGFAPERLDLSSEDEPNVTVLESAGRVVRYGDPIVFASPGPGTVTLPAVASLSRVRA